MESCWSPGKSGDRASPVTSRQDTFAKTLSRQCREAVWYFDVPAEVYRGLVAAESHGRYFNQHIRNKSYRYQRMN
jgi:hypothetical protein